MAMNGTSKKESASLRMAGVLRSVAIPHQRRPTIAEAYRREKSKITSGERGTIYNDLRQKLQGRGRV